MSRDRASVEGLLPMAATIAGGPRQRLTHVSSFRHGSSMGTGDFHQLPLPGQDGSWLTMASTTRRCSGCNKSW